MAFSFFRMSLRQDDAAAAVPESRFSSVVRGRPLVDRPAGSSARATRLIENDLTPDDPGYVSVIVMAEFVWVLERAYRLRDAEIAAAVERLLQADVLLIESEQDVFTAMIALKDGRGSFADALIGARGARAGCSRTATFDRQALRLRGFARI